MYVAGRKTEGEVQAGATYLKEKRPMASSMKQNHKNENIFFLLLNKCRNLQNKGMILKLFFHYSESRCLHNPKERSNLGTKEFFCL